MGRMVEVPFFSHRGGEWAEMVSGQEKRRMVSGGEWCQVPFSPTGEKEEKRSGAFFR